MCGILGYYGKPSTDMAKNQKVATLFDHILLRDEVRGRHSTGWVALADKHYHFRKKAVSASEFIGDGLTAKLYGLTNIRTIFGHNRFATHGDVNDRNAHPFILRRRYIGMHNGVLNNHERLAEKFGIAPAKVDSETFFRCVAKRIADDNTPIADAIEEVVNVTTEVGGGSMAMAFMDMNDRSLYLWRNEGNPLWLWDLRKHGLGRFFTSTKTIFADAYLPLSGLIGSAKEVTGYELKAWRLYRLDAKSGNVEVVKEEMKHSKPAYPTVRWYGNDEDFSSHQKSLFSSSDQGDDLSSSDEQLEAATRKYLERKEELAMREYSEEEEGDLAMIPVERVLNAVEMYGYSSDVCHGCKFEEVCDKQAANCILSECETCPKMDECTLAEPDCYDTLMETMGLSPKEEQVLAYGEGEDNENESAAESGVEEVSLESLEDEECERYGEKCDSCEQESSCNAYGRKLRFA